MSEMGLEAPEPDAAEQQRDVAVEPGEDDETGALTESPLEANEADAVEQSQTLDTGEEDYR
jgi:hypothetical protein